MKNVTATEADRNFSDLLAQIGPAPVSSGATAKKLLKEFPPDKGWTADLAEVRSQLIAEDRSWND